MPKAPRERAGWLGSSFMEFMKRLMPPWPPIRRQGPDTCGTGPDCAARHTGTHRSPAECTLRNAPDPRRCLRVQTQGRKQDHEKECPIRFPGDVRLCSPVLFRRCRGRGRGLHPGRHRPGSPEGRRQREAARQQRRQEDQGLVPRIGLHAAPVGRLCPGQRSARGGRLHPLQGDEGKLRCSQRRHAECRRQGQWLRSVGHL